LVRIQTLYPPPHTLLWKGRERGREWAGVSRSGARAEVGEGGNVPVALLGVAVHRAATEWALPGLRVGRPTGGE
jgi:hypothetical protein